MANEQLITLYRFNLGYAERLMADVAEDQMAHQPAPGTHTPGWIIGHIALVNEVALGTLGGEGGRLPESWNAAAEFGAGSSPEPIGDGYPPKEELMAKLAETAEPFLAAVEGVDLATLTDPNPIEQLRAALPTKGDLIAHVLSTHFATHLGQLSTWRRQMGFPPLF